MSDDLEHGAAAVKTPTEVPSSGVPEAPEAQTHPRRMLDRYEVIAEIARGGMGTVLLARLTGAGGFERLMAIKLMHEHLAEDGAFVTMLLDEARTAANIHHPNAVGIVDVAESPLGYYLVMSYVEGFTLADLLAHEELTDRERIRLGLRLVVDACHGLHAAHTTKNARGEALGIVHRDVSPQNILVGLDGVGRIVDFGIALAASRMAMSRPGMIKGKPSYMAPEQVRSEECLPCADVFALGIVAWEVLVGHRLFQAELDLATLMMVIDAPIPAPKSLQPLVNDGVNAAVLRALVRDRSERTRDARTLGTELEKAAKESDLIATSVEVSDAIERLFKDRIEQKQAAIRHHLATSTGEQKPLGPGQLSLIPKLSSREPNPRSSELGTKSTNSGVRQRTENHSTASSDPRVAATLSLRSGEVHPGALPEPRSEQPDLDSGEQTESPASEPQPSLDESTQPTGDASTEVTEGKRAAWPLLGAALIAIALGVAAAAYFASAEAEQAQPAAPARTTPTPTAPANSAAEQTAPEPTSAQTTGADIPENASDGDTNTDIPDHAREDGAGGEEAAPPDLPRPLERETPRAGRRGLGRSRAAEPTPSGPTLEANPYLTQ